MPTNLFIPFGSRKNCHSSERNLLLYLFIIRVIKLTNNYRGTSPTAYKILSTILISSLTPHVDKITGDYQCGFWRNTTTDQIFCVHQILEKKWEYKGTVHQLFIDSEKACDSGEKYCTVVSLNLVYP